MSAVSRPTSPHLTIYRPQITSMLSILHRVTGVGLYAGTVVLMLWLWSAAYAADIFAKLHECFASPVGLIFLIGWTAAFYYHLCNGIRHLFWDMGKGLDISCATRSGWLVLVATALMTIFSWGFALNSVGM